MHEIMLFAVAVVTNAIVHPPRNEVVVAGGDVHMTCRTGRSPNEKHEIYWMYNSRSLSQVLLSVSKVSAVIGRFRNRSRIVNETDLLITSVQREDSGFYICSEKNHNKHAAQLIVLRECGMWN